MDAKAKVNTFDHAEFGMRLNDKGLGDYVRIEDHEAAMAALRSWKLEVVSRLGMDDWNADSTTPTDVHRHVQWLEDRAKASLLTGLEALAGEWERLATAVVSCELRQDQIMEDTVNRMFRDCAASLRTLTNSAKASNEESK